jgi:hypothetical protein
LVLQFSWRSFLWCSFGFGFGFGSAAVLVVEAATLSATTLGAGLVTRGFILTFTTLGVLVLVITGLLRTARGFTFCLWLWRMCL